MSKFGDIAVNGFFLCFGEAYMKTTTGDGFDNVPNAFNFVMGEPVEFDPNWDVEAVTYREVVKLFFGIIFKRVSDG